jgi:hypothetical protein
MEIYFRGSICSRTLGNWYKSVSLPAGDRQILHCLDGLVDSLDQLLIEAGLIATNSLAN